MKKSLVFNLKNVIPHLIIILLLSGLISCQKKTEIHSFNPAQWTIPMDSVLIDTMSYKGKHAIQVNNLFAEDGGIIYLKDFNFKNGTIECDIASDIFTGIAFRVKDHEHAECVYFRPFNAGTEKHGNTVQYVAKGSKYTWQYLRKTYPHVYEAGANIRVNEWFHVKFDVEGTTMKLYVNEAEEPVLVITDLKYGKSSGSVGFWTWKGKYANLVITNR